MVEGDAEVRRSSRDEWQPLQPRMRIYKGDAIKVAKNSYVDIRVKNKYDLRLAQNTMAVARKRKGKMINFSLEKGAVIAKVINRRKLAGFRVTTPTSIVKVTGEAFMIDVAEDGSANIAVIDGRGKIISTKPTEPEEIDIYSGQEIGVRGDKIIKEPRNISDRVKRPIRDFVR